MLQISVELAEQERDSYAGPPQAFESHKKRQAKEIFKHMRGMSSQVVQGYAVLTRRLIDERMQDPQLRQNLKVSDFTIKPAKRPARGSGFQDPPAIRFGLSKKGVSEMFRMACFMADSGESEEAKNAFLFLSFYCPNLLTVWMTQGALLEKLEEFDAALESYKMAMIAAPFNSKGYEHAVRVAAQLEKEDELSKIVEAAERVINEVAESGDVEELSERLPLYRSTLSEVSGG